MRWLVQWAELALGFVTAMFGALGGLGGAVLLVPMLVLTGTSPRLAAPLGLVSVAAGSLSASVPQLAERRVNHRFGVTTEIAATAGAVVGALGSSLASDTFLQRTLAIVAILAAFAGGRRKGIRNLPDPSLGPDDVGEHVGSLSGVYQLDDGYVPYCAKRLRPGLGLFAASGLLAGLSGASGGFVKTPASSEVMHVPIKVAASTTTFTIGVTAAAGLSVFALQGRIEAHTAASVCVGSLLGGRVGSSLQSRLSPPQIRRTLSVLLVVVGVVLLVRS